MIVLQFPLPSNDALAVSDHVIGQCKYGKCLTIYYGDLKAQTYSWNIN